MRNILKNTEASVIKSVLEVMENCKQISPDIQYEEVDARKELADGELPPTDIVGVTQFAMAQLDSHMWEIHFIVAVSTVNDLNLFRLRELTNEFYDHYSGNGRQLTYYDAESAEEKSWIYVLPQTQTLPTHRVETRPFRFVQVQALLDPLQASEREPQSLVP